MQLDPLDGHGPLYRQLYRALRSAILDGRAKAGMRLPSTRWVAEESGVARNRVVLAYAQLVDEGYASGRVGSGTYVAEELPGPERAASAAAPTDAPAPTVRLSRGARRGRRPSPRSGTTSAAVVRPGGISRTRSGRAWCGAARAS